MCFETIVGKLFGYIFFWKHSYQSDNDFFSDQVCGLPRVVDYGYLTDVTGVEKGENATYQCIPGYELRGSKTVVCQNGKWGEAPVCIGKCSVHFIMEILCRLRER